MSNHLLNLIKFFNNHKDSIKFILIMWFSSRLLIIISMQVIAPIVPFSPTSFNSGILPVELNNYSPSMSWELFSHWDGIWYKKIVEQGYSYSPNNPQNSVAFFPLFPVIVRVIMLLLGINFEMASLFLNLLLFIVTLFWLYQWVEKKHGTSVAKWSIAVIVWCPFSLFVTVSYTEALFLFCTTAALKSFDEHNYLKAAFWGAMTTATRVPGIVLIPTFLLVSWLEKRTFKAYIAALIPGTGLLTYIIYCTLQFGEPLAFLHTQTGWPQKDWFSVLSNVLHIHSLFQNLSATSSFNYLLECLKIVMIFGTLYLLLQFRRQLSNTVVIYGLCSLALILVAGTTLSVHRYAYGSVSFSVALGFLLARYPRFGYGLIGFFIPLLIVFAIRFSWWQWVA